MVLKKDQFQFGLHGDGGDKGGWAPGAQCIDGLYQQLQEAIRRGLCRLRQARGQQRGGGRHRRSLCRRHC